MNKNIIRVFSLIICLGWSLLSYTQICGPQSGGGGIIGGKVIISYGATTNSVTPKFASNILLGQAVIGQNNSTTIVAEYGFYTQFLLPPLPPTVTASQGELLDRIQVSWALDPLGSAPNEGFNLFRDGVFIQSVGPKVRNFNDFNVIAGRPYTYSVTGLNKFGEGFAGEGLGFQVPNGVVTGWVSTLNNRPVPGAQVSLLPMQGFSAKFGADDGGVAIKDDNQPFLPTAGQDWTMTFWMNTDSSNANPDVISFSGSTLAIKALPGANGVSITQGANNLTSNFASNEWHHITLGYEAAANTGRLYIDGILQDQSTMSNISSPDFINFGQDLGSNGWSGYLDEFRIYHTLLDELDLGMVMEGTASSTTPFLSHYWKFDEELGEKSFDIMNRHQLYFCGAEFDAERPPVRTAAVTNEEGYYLIEGVSYGTGTTFIAEPEKNFYLHRSLDFTKDSLDHITLPDFALPAKTTIELWVNNTNAGSIQTILSKKAGSNSFKIYSELQGGNNLLKIDINGNIQSFGNLQTGFNHIAIAIDSLNAQIKGYINGGTPTTRTYSIPSDWSDTAYNWYVAADSDGSMTSDYFNGLIDEVAVYDTLLSHSTILVHAQNARDLTADGLVVYFPMDEGSGIRVNNVGSILLDVGSIEGAEWSNFAANQETTPHKFTPKTRQVTLNPSVTSVDQVDFTDLSTIPVSGYVRYKNTDCFAPNVEILVNGSSFSPNVYTDSLGKFVVDFDPGATAILEPKFEDHVFVPAFYELTSVSSPIAGILFNDITTRKVSGQVAGGSNPSCKKSIIEPGAICRVEVSSVNGCLIRTFTINDQNQEGIFEFLELPPLERMNVAVIEHSTDKIKTAFQVQGGYTVNLTKADTIIDFIYTAPPEVEMNNGLDPEPGCMPEVIVLDKFSTVTVEIKVKETYIPILASNDNGICYLDTADLQIINGFADQSLDTFMSGGSLDYTFIVGNPNPSPPYKKTMQVIATSVPAGRVGSLVKNAVVTGVLKKLNTFTTMMPLIPSLILRDPPGDGSSSFIEKSEKMCKTTEMSMVVEAGANISADIEIAPTINFVIAPFGLGKITTVDPDFQINTEFELTYEKQTDSSFQTCVTFNRKISTSDADVIVGGERGGDLYMGEAINLIFGNIDEVSFANCEVSVEEKMQVEPGDFATTFIYSEFNIINSVLPNLKRLKNDTLVDPIDSLEYEESIARWEAIIRMNDTLKQDAKYLRNISFDAGVSYEYSETADTIVSSSDQNGINTDSKIGTTFGVSVDNIGASIKVNAVVKSSNTWKTEDGTEKGLTTGYILSDDDPGDAFTVDIAMDSVYKTPVFQLKAGQSSCPWEPGTANREGPNLQFAEGTPYTAVNVPANESAVFKFVLGNASATNEDWTYGFTSIAGSNPDGAILRVNGTTLNNNTIKFIVPFGESIPITLTVDRGPIEYEYSNLLVALVSECELDRNFGLGLPLLDDTLFFSSFPLGVDFIRPCSEVKINVPEQNWVVINDDDDQPGTLRKITVSGYDLNSPDFQLVRMQYRQSDGNGAWINLPTTDGVFEAFNPRWSGFVSPPTAGPDTLLLGPNFTHFYWETAGIEDGNYEFHAWAVCSGDASDKPGFSDIIKGKIDRQPPALLGVPHPSDGVYHVGDEISFTFNQDVNCNKLIQADITQPNNIGLYDATTGNLIDATISCFNNKIIIDPNFQNEFYENKIMRAELHNIQDLVGNNMIFEKWEFYVDRNELAWLTDSIQLTKFVDESKTITAKIHNRGGYPVPYTIQNIPDWVHVSPNAGTLVANEVEEIHFTVDAETALGLFSDSIILHTETGLNPFFMGGDEILNMAARVICRPPNWVLNPGGFDPSEYSYSMNFSVELDIEGNLSEDVQDIVGAYVSGQLRGISKVEYNQILGQYVAFLTVYSNVSSGELVEFQIWDASDCQLYGSTIETFTFVADGIVGSPLVPQVLHTKGEILRRIYIHPGWNWISVNMALLDTTTNAAMASLTNPAGGLIKSQKNFSNYSLILQTWEGTLPGVSIDSMYQYNSLAYDSLLLVGNLIDVTKPIPLSAGWNWIGYLPQSALPINVALASISPQHGDIIKSQLTFAQYVTGLGWIGNLKFLNAPNGYLLKLTNSDILTYPDPNNLRGETISVNRNINPTIDASKTAVDATDQSWMPYSYWQVDPTKYEHSMNVIAVVVNGESVNMLADGDEVAAFVGGEVRGSGKVIYIQGLDAHMLFLTVYANQDGELMTFKYYDSSDNIVYDIEENTGFDINSLWGLVDDPEFLHLAQVSGTSEINMTASRLEVYPNPFAQSIFLNFYSESREEITVKYSDAYGKIIETRLIEADRGLNVIEWKPSPNVAVGTYFINIQSSNALFKEKVLYIK